MSATVNVAEVGTFTKLTDRTAVLGGLPPRLNENPHLYGKLRTELDLDIGCEGYRDTRSRDSRFNSMFDYIRQTSKQGSSLKDATGADIVANRRILVTLAQSPYKLDPIQIQAVRKNGVVLMCDKRNDFTSCPSGFKFEQYLTLNKYGKAHDKYEKLSPEGGCSKSVLRTTISSGNNKIKVFYAAEMDAIDKTGKYVELKTTGLNHATWLEVASLRTYLQCYFANVPYIVYGRKRTPRTNIVHRVDKVHTSNIPRYPVKWKKEVCFDQLFHILNTIMKNLPNDDDAIILNVTKHGLTIQPELAQNCTFLDESLLAHFE